MFDAPTLLTEEDLVVDLAEQARRPGLAALGVGQRTTLSALIGKSGFSVKLAGRTAPAHDAVGAAS
jgi:hypothetical protein